MGPRHRWDDDPPAPRERLAATGQQGVRFGVLDGPEFVVAAAQGAVESLRVPADIRPTVHGPALDRARELLVEIVDHF